MIHTIARRTLAPLGASLVLTLGLAACSGPSEADLTQSAQSMLDAKDARGAIIQIKSALQKNPDSGKARLLLGKALLEMGDPVSALVELHKAQELHVPDEQVLPELARGMVLIGEHAKLISQFGQLELKDPEAAASLQTSLATAYAGTGNPAKAKAAIERALAAKPGYTAAVVFKARLAAADGDVDGALALLESVLSGDPSNQAAGTFKGEVLLRGKNDPEAALKAFAKVLEAHPRAVAAHSATITALRAQNKTAEAKAQFEKLKAAAPDHPETLLLQMQFAFIEQNYKAARELGARLLKDAPENVKVLELAGATEYRLKNYMQAEAYLGHALKNVPGLLLSRQLLAQSYLRLGQPAKTVEVLGPLIEAREPDGTSLALAGEAWLQMGEARKSEQAFQRAAKAAPGDNRVRTSAAMAQLARGNASAAIPELEAIANEDKGPRADLALVSARLGQNDLPGALKAIDKLQAKLPDSPMPANLRGRVLMLSKDLIGASKSFELSLSKDAHYFPAVAGLAAMELNAGRPDGARKRFEDLLKLEPNNYQAMLALAELTVRTGGSPQAILGYMRDAARLNPTEPTPQLILVRYLLNIGDAKAALVAAQQADSAIPGNVDLLESLGRAQLASNDANQALTTFNRLVSMQPTNAMHHVRLAEIYAAKGDKSAAAKALDRALEVQPNFDLAKRAQVSLAVADQRYDDAMVIVHALQKASPKDPVPWLLEGEVESTRKNLEAAVSAYRGALQRQTSAENTMKLHSALLRAGKRADADALAASWNKDHPQDAAFLYYLGDTALAAGDLAGAEKLYRDVLVVQPRNALALNNVAWLLVKQGKPGAVAAAEQANTLLPDRSSLLDTLATALAGDKKFDKAVETQKRAIGLDPQNPTLKLNLARLYIQAGDKAQARAELEDLARLGNRYPKQDEVASLLKSL